MLASSSFISVAIIVQEVLALTEGHGFEQSGVRLALQNKIVAMVRLCCLRVHIRIMCVRVHFATFCVCLCVCKISAYVVSMYVCVYIYIHTQTYTSIHTFG
jgi:hypothetical protein